MSKKSQAILLVHGMGKHSAPSGGNPGSFKQEFIDATTESLQSYSKYKTVTLAAHVDIHEFNYDQWFDTVRTRMADRAKEMQQRVEDISQVLGVSFAGDLVAMLTNLEAEFGDDELMYTHWLDVVFYTTILGGKVRVDAAKKVAELVAEYGAGNVHVIAHCLGTAVIHDTLHLLYRAEHDPIDEIPDLDLVNHRLGSIWMLGNVSRMVNSVVQLFDPLRSVVKPGDKGCANYFINIRHKLDPFTWLAQFDPKNNGSWVDAGIYATDYRNYENRLVVDANTHAFKPYVREPQVSESLLYQMIDEFEVDVEELDRVKMAYEATAINGAYVKLESAFNDLSHKDKATWKDFFHAAKTMQSAIKDIQAEQQVGG